MYDYIIQGILIERITDEEIMDIARRLNNMPRKALNYQTLPRSV